MRKVITQIILSVPIFLIILYRGYKFEINLSSILYILTYLFMILMYVYFNRDKLKK